MKEFELIKRFFATHAFKRKDVIIGIGDDCALVSPPQKQNLAITTDTLVAGVHFPKDLNARAIGHKAIAVNLSDLAAMGAEPHWISLAITLPKADEAWLTDFCEGVFELCDYFNVQLIGGDTTQGPLSITVTAQGTVPDGKELTRSGAKVGDWLYVTGEIGDAALALQHRFKKVDVAEQYVADITEKLDYPRPRMLAGQALRAYASSAIDLSDGLIADLNHICQSSSVGANVVLDDLPISNALVNSLGKEKAYQLALSGGDDYELLFTVSETNRVGMETAIANTGTDVTCIGQLNNSGKITTTLNNKPTSISIDRYQHFSKTNS